MKKQKFFLGVSVLAISATFLLAGYSIRWARLKSGDLQVFEKHIPIPLTEIQNPQSGINYYYIDKYRVFTYSGDYPLIVREEKIDKDRAKIYMEPQ